MYQVIPFIASDRKTCTQRAFLPPSCAQNRPLCLICWPINVSSILDLLSTAIWKTVMTDKQPFAPNPPPTMSSTKCAESSEVGSLPVFSALYLKLVYPIYSM